MDPKLAVLPILVLVISLSTIGLVHADSSYNETNSAGTTDAQSVQTAQAGISCAQDDITAAKQGLSDIQKKMADLRTEYYNDWQTEHNSGQYNGTWEQYSREKVLSSSDIAQIKSDYQKYSSVLRSCGISPMHPHSSSTCSQDDITHARQELATSEKQGNDLKFKTYQQFQQDQASGQFNGTWSQYAQEKFWNLPDLAQLKSTHDKFTSFLKSCFGQQMSTQASGASQNLKDSNMPPPPPDNSNYNPISSDKSIPRDLGLTGSNDISSNDISSAGQSENPVPPISSPTDALGAVSSHGIPGWVKGIAGWWAQGKISDDEFVSAIKFLVHQGIIKL